MAQVKPIKHTEIPFIPEHLDRSQLHLLIPDGFDFIETDIQHTTLVVRVKESDDVDAEAKIEEVMYNPLHGGTFFPRFLIETSTLTTKKVVYDESSYLNQNQMLYWIIQHRCCQFAEQIKEGRKAYAYLLANDIANMTKYITYVRPRAYNAKQAASKTTVILSPWHQYEATVKNLKLSHNTIGDALKSPYILPKGAKLKTVLRSLDIYPSSESAASKSGKFVVHNFKDEPLYRSVGFKINADRGTMTSIFPAKQNMVARLKTHCISDAYELKFPSNSVFFQDMLPNKETKQYEPRDNCLREAIVVFSLMGTHDTRFVCGEIEVSKAFCETELWVEEAISEQFLSLNISEGETIVNPHGKIVIGTKIDETFEYIYAHEVVCVSITPIGMMGVQRVRLKVKRLVGNSRIDSNTGLKGVTKCKGNLGEIEFPDRVIKPDMVVGMNATKAKHNTIVLAQAALAVKLGYYTPTNKFGLLDTLNEQEINKAADSLPPFTYTDQFGIDQKVYVGLAYPRVTELASTYGKFKAQSFMFETGRLLAQNGNKDLFDYIWSTQIKQKYKDMITEFQKILLDQGYSYPEDNLPSYTPKQLVKDKLIKRGELITSKVQYSKIESILLDEEWNKGFYLDLSTSGQGIIRMPSATTINNLVNQLPNKDWVYPIFFVSMCKILNCCLPDSQGRINLGYIKPRVDTGRSNLYQRYYSDIKGTLFTSDTNAQMMMQKLLKPEVMGFGAKQSTDALIPPNTMVIMCNRTYKNIIKTVYGEGEEAELNELMNPLRGFQCRNPVLWLSQVTNMRVWNRDEFSYHLATVHKLRLEEYLPPAYNSDIILLDTHTVQSARADCDGDLAPVFFIPFNKETPSFNKMIPCKEEQDWLAEYAKGEREVDDVMLEPLKPYTLYETPLIDTIDQKTRTMNTGYATYLYQGMEAKAAIGEQKYIYS